MGEIIYNRTKEELLETIDGVLDSMSDNEKKALIDEVNYELTMTLPGGKIINFTSEQYQGIQNIRKWLGSDKKFFTLAGYAGTGKSTIVKRIIDEFKGNLVVSAPTHKAKKVIMRTTLEEGETLHALLGLRPDVDLDDFNPNDPRFSPIAKPRIADYHLVIIDEASMINQELFNLIQENTKSWNIKVLYMGDPAQTPPIGERGSVVFTAENVERHELTKVMRQEDGNPLFVVYDALRNNLFDVWGGFTRETKMNSKDEGIIFTNSKKVFRKRLLEIFDSVEYSKDYDHAKLIAWRNDTVMLSNSVIRNGIFGKDVPFLVTGDVLMAYRSIRSSRQYFNIIDNSEDYRVMKVSKKLRNQFDLWGYRVNLRETLPDGKFMHKNVFIIDHTDHDNLHTYAEIHDGLKLIAKGDKKKWRAYYGFRRESILMQKIETFRDGSTRFFDDVIVKDLDYGYAITCHKAQGSTYNHVFVLEDDIMLNTKIKERNQIKYVALTRPTTTATVLTSIR